VRISPQHAWKETSSVKEVTSTVPVGRRAPRYSYDTLRLSGSYDLA